VKGRSNVNCPRLTGIPPHIALMNQMVSMESEFSGVGDRVISEMKIELNKRGVGGEVFQANDILESVRAVHEEMRRELQASRNENGGNRTRVSTEGTNTVVQVGNGGGGDGSHELFFWGGSFHTVPEGFYLPRMNLQTLILCWWVGMKYPRHIPPLRFVKKRDFGSRQKVVGNTLSQMKMMMDSVYHCGQQHGFDFGVKNINVRNPAGATALYNLVEPFYRFERLSLDRFAQLSWKTIFCQWSQHYGSRYIGQIGDVRRSRRVE